MDPAEMPAEIPGQLALDLGEADTELRRRQLAATLEEQRRANAETCKEMLALQAQPDPFLVIMLRINQILNTILGDEGCVGRLEFETEFELDIAEMLGDCLKQARQRALVAGINPYKKQPPLPPRR